MWTRDNLDILRGLNSESIDLVYADPTSGPMPGTTVGGPTDLRQSVRGERVETGAQVARRSRRAGTTPCGHPPRDVESERGQRVRRSHVPMSDTLKQEYQEKLGKDFGTVLYEIRNDWLTALVRLKEYRVLFSDHDAVKLLNAAGAAFM